jgi:hypothetical protein
MNAILDAVTNSLQERLRISRLFRQNFCRKHGLTYPDAEEPVNVNINVKTEPPPAAPKPTTAETRPEPKPVESKPVEPKPETKAEPWWKRYAVPLAAAAVLGGTGLGTIGGVLATRKPDPPAVVKPVERPKDGSLLQYLQDEGYHVP